MSEPISAFLKLQIICEELERWLQARPSPASRWTDWRSIGGQWYIGDGPVQLVDASDAEIDGILQGADTRLLAFADNRELLHRLLTDSAEAPQLRLSAFDQQGETFVAGSLTYSENLADFVVFLAMARSVADYLAPSGHGIAIVHNYLWGGDEEQVTTAALRMMPSGESHLLPEADWQSVAPAFQPIADALIEGRLPAGFPTRDELCPPR